MFLKQLDWLQQSYISVIKQICFSGTQYCKAVLKQQVYFLGGCKLIYDIIEIIPQEGGHSQATVQHRRQKGINLV